MASAPTTLSNTYLGLTTNFFPDSRLTVCLQVNYLLAGGDQQNYTGLSAYRDDTFLLQLQVEAFK